VPTGNEPAVANNRRQMRVTREQVWAVLSDGHRYAEWVVGTDHIRDVDSGFPTVGSRLHYTVGRGPLRHEGHTEVLAVTAGQEIELEAHAWPLGTARIVLRLSDGDAGCSVEIEEHPSRGVARRLHNPVLDLAVKARNVETLRRLERAAAQA
jgi:uncharacterized protein YndB with AHSA1/START domain